MPSSGFEVAVTSPGKDARNGKPRAEYLAVSGGGDDGAFGAGLLVGWSAAGTRPQFKGVTERQNDCSFNFRQNRDFLEGKAA